MMSGFKQGFRGPWLQVVALLGMLLGLVSAHAQTTVFAAASLTDVLPALADRYVERGGEPLRFSFASSSTLARQVENGAEASIFISADEEWMDYLQSRGLVASTSRRDVAGNQLVLIAPADSTLVAQTLDRRSPIAQWLGKGRLAVGDPAHVPVGRYAQAALTTLGLWESIAGHLAPAESTRTAMQYVASGESPLGIVYRSDLYHAKGVKEVAKFATGLHPAIRYPAAVISAHATEEARAFIEFINSPEAADLWVGFGFDPLLAQ